jgi:hypothetical protein
MVIRQKSCRIMQRASRAVTHKYWTYSSKAMADYTLFMVQRRTLGSMTFSSSTSSKIAYTCISYSRINFLCHFYAGFCDFACQNFYVTYTSIISIKRPSLKKNDTQKKNNSQITGYPIYYYLFVIYYYAFRFIYQSKLHQYS